MLLDKLLVFSSGQAVTATAASTSSVDVSEARDLGNGEPVYVVCIVTVAFTDGSSNSTVTVSLETDDDTAFGSVTAAQTLGTFAALSAAGSRLAQVLQLDRVNERYMQMKYTVANGDLTTGSFTSFLCYDVQAFVAYPDAVTIN